MARPARTVMYRPRLSVIIASSGRPTLQRTLDSVNPQLREGDECLVSMNLDCPWGHAARNQLMRAARGDALMFIDDDDWYTPGALELVRARIRLHAWKVHLFRMRYRDGRLLWADPEVRDGNVSTQMVVTPPPLRAQWGDRYQGDLDFIRGLQAEFGEPCWHTPVIAEIGK